MKKLPESSSGRIAGVLALSLALAIFIPYGGSELEGFLNTHALNIGILYAIIIGFLMSLALTRRQSLEEYVTLELNKIRRMHHLGLHLAKIEPRLDPWFSRLKTAIEAYQERFRLEGFNGYEKGNSLFRTLTYAIYELPTLGLPYNSDLYGALLDAAGSATEAREYIRAKMTNSISRYQWKVIGLVTFTFCVIISAASIDGLVARALTAVVVFNIFLTLELLYRYDRIGEKRDRRLADLYAWNLSRK